MTYNNFHYALSLLDQLYGLNMTEDNFEEIGLLAWNQIGNKRCKLYRYVASAGCDMKIELPCNVDILEAVTAGFEDFQHVSNTHSHSLPGSFVTEQYIEHHKHFKNPLYTSGKYIPYERVGNILYFREPYQRVHILYKGIVLDEEGLPEITDNEAMAIATFCAYTIKFKEALAQNNPNSLKLAETLKQQWLKQCDHARVPEEINQNEMDEILDAKTSWDRKIFTRSYKPVR